MVALRQGLETDAHALCSKFSGKGGASSVYTGLGGNDMALVHLPAKFRSNCDWAAPNQVT